MSTSQKTSHCVLSNRIGSLYRSTLTNTSSSKIPQAKLFYSAFTIENTKCSLLFKCKATHFPDLSPRFGNSFCVRRSHCNSCGINIFLQVHSGIWNHQWVSEWLWDRRLSCCRTKQFLSVHPGKKLQCGPTRPRLFAEYLGNFRFLLATVSPAVCGPVMLRCQRLGIGTDKVSTLE